jgi:hypothetical protein
MAVEDSNQVVVELDATTIGRTRATLEQTPVRSGVGRLKRSENRPLRGPRNTASRSSASSSSVSERQFNPLHRACTGL